MLANVLFIGFQLIEPPELSASFARLYLLHLFYDSMSASKTILALRQDVAAFGDG